MGLKEEFEQVRSRGNNSRHRTKVERVNGAIAVGETMEGVVDQRVQKVQVSNKG